jgi:tetratricopeptide (TPR) repeat protein
VTPLYKKGEFIKSIEYLEKSLFISEKINGDYHESSGMSYASIGLVYSSKKDSIKAKYFYEKAYSIFFKTLGEEHTKTKGIKRKITELNDL